ncbi:MAG: hypothetical protein MZU97_00475 [Bacillus subtilis]|nr:hypothetical protein [Bacillus subtilis]
MASIYRTNRFIQRIADLFVKEGEYAGTTPPSPTNIAISNQSLVYTARRRRFRHSRNLMSMATTF